MNTSPSEVINTITNSPLSPGRSRIYLFSKEYNRSPRSTMTAFQQSTILNPQRGDDDPHPFSKENSMANKQESLRPIEEWSLRSTLKMKKVPSPSPKLMTETEKDFTFAENPRHIV